MASQGIEGETFGNLSKTELVAKLKEVRELISKDAEKMKQQENTIRKQQEVLANIRSELVEIKKQMLVDGAKLTEQEFRDTVRKYLTEIRSDLQGMIDTKPQSQTTFSLFSCLFGF